MDFGFSSRAMQREQISTWVQFYDVGAATRALRHLLAVWAVVIAAFCVFLMVMGVTAATAKAQSVALPVLVTPVAVTAQTPQNPRADFVPSIVLYHPKVVRACDKPRHNPTVESISQYRTCLNLHRLEALNRL
jgi:hypothetical protein